MDQLDTWVLFCRAVLGILPEHFEVAAGSIELVGRDVARLTRKEWTALRGSTVSAVRTGTAMGAARAGTAEIEW